MTNLPPLSRRFLLAAAALALAPAMASAQSWPTAKPIRIVVAYPAGGVSDNVARALADKLAVQLGTPVVIENKAGASGSLGVDAVAKAAPDGYTLGFAAVSPLALNPHLGKSPFDPQKDIAPVVSVMYSPVLLLGTSASKATDFKDLLATAQAKPGAVRWATSGQASLGHREEVAHQVRPHIGPQRDGVVVHQLALHHDARNRKARVAQHPPHPRCQHGQGAAHEQDRRGQVHELDVQGCGQRVGHQAAFGLAGVSNAALSRMRRHSSS